MLISYNEISIIKNYLSRFLCYFYCCLLNLMFEIVLHFTHLEIFQYNQIAIKISINSLQLLDHPKTYLWAHPLPKSTISMVLQLLLKLNISPVIFKQFEI